MSDEEEKDESNNYDIISSVKITRKKAYNKYITELWKDLSLQSPDIWKVFQMKCFILIDNYPQLINKHLFSLFGSKIFNNGMNTLHSNDFNILINLKSFD